jgi:hypothetical protein
MHRGGGDLRGAALIRGYDVLHRDGRDGRDGLT